MVVVVSLIELLRFCDNCIVPHVTTKLLYPDTQKAYANTQKAYSFAQISYSYTQISYSYTQIGGFMSFNKCLHCQSIREGKCGGPNFMAMSTKEVVEWATKYQKINGISNAQLAEWSGIPKGTIEGIKYRDDVRHDTIYRLLQALIEGVGGQWGGEPCAVHPESDAQTKDALENLKRENKFLQETIEHERKHLKYKNRAILTLTITLGVLVCGLLVALFVL